MQETARLRPLDLGDILDGTFRLYRNNFVTLLGIVALSLVPLSILKVLGALLTRDAVTDQLGTLGSVPGLPLLGAQWFAILGAYNNSGVNSLLGLLQGLVLQPLITTALVYAVSRRYLGLPATIMDSYRFGFGKARFLSVLAAQLLIGIGLGLAIGLPFACVFIGLGVGIGAAAGASDGSTALAALGLVGGLVGLLIVAVFIIAALVLSTRLGFYPQAVVVEGQGPIESISRSWRLVKGMMWRTVGIVLVLTFLGGVLSTIILLLLLAIGGLVGVTIDNPIESYGLIVSFFELIQLLSTMLVLPFTLIGLTLLYYDLRVRKEGLDLELQANALSAAPPFNLERSES